MKTRLQHERKPARRIPKDLPATRAMLRFLLKRHSGHTHESLLELAAGWASEHGGTIDETLYLLCRS